MERQKGKGREGEMVWIIGWRDLAGPTQKFWRGAPYASRQTYSCNNADRAEQLKTEYQSLRNEYRGLPISDAHTFDTDLVSLKRL